MAGSVIRPDLVIPYKHVPAKARAEATGMVSQTLPMAAMFMRNKVLSWSAIFLAVQSYLNEPINKLEEKDDKSVSQPPLLRILFAFISLATCYMDLIFPGSSPRAAVQKAAESVAAATA